MSDSLRGGSTVGGNIIWHTGNLDNSNVSNILAGNTVTLTGDATGTGTLDSNGNVSFVTTVVDNSHTHTGSTISALDGADITTGTISDDRLPSTISSNITGNSATATKLATARTIDITGDITATAVAFDGTANIAISASVNNNSHTHDQTTITNSADSDKLNGKTNTTASTGSTIVERDSSGDINARLFRSEYDTTNDSCNYFMTQVDTASNNYLRPSTKAQVRTALNIADGATANSAESVNESANTLVKRDGSGYIHNSYFNTSAGFTSALPTAIFVETGGDGYIRKQTTANLRANIGAEPADATILKDADIGTKVLAPNGDASQLTNLPSSGAKLLFDKSLFGGM